MDGYSPAWEIINAEISRLELPDGWLILARSHLIMGGKDYFAARDVVLYHDPEKKWRIKTK